MARQLREHLTSPDRPRPDLEDVTAADTVETVRIAARRPADEREIARQQEVASLVLRAEEAEERAREAEERAREAEERAAREQKAASKARYKKEMDRAVNRFPTFGGDPRMWEPFKRQFIQHARDEDIEFMLDPFSDQTPSDRDHELLRRALEKSDGPKLSALFKPQEFGNLDGRTIWTSLLRAFDVKRTLGKVLADFNELLNMKSTNLHPELFAAEVTNSVEKALRHVTSMRDFKQLFASAILLRGSPEIAKCQMVIQMFSNSDEGKIPTVQEIIQLYTKNPLTFLEHRQVAHVATTSPVKPCFNFRKGKCNRGTDCPYAHDEVEGAHAPHARGPGGDGSRRGGRGGRGGRGAHARSSTNRRRPGPDVCYRCNNSGHHAHECTVPLSKICCTICSRKGHSAGTHDIYLSTTSKAIAHVLKEQQPGATQGPQVSGPPARSALQELQASLTPSTTTPVLTLTHADYMRNLASTPFQRLNSVFTSDHDDTSASDVSDYDGDDSHMDVVSTGPFANPTRGVGMRTRFARSRTIKFYMETLGESLPPVDLRSSTPVAPVGGSDDGMDLRPNDNNVDDHALAIRGQDVIADTLVATSPLEANGSRGVSTWQPDPAELRPELLPQDTPDHGQKDNVPGDGSSDSGPDPSYDSQDIAAIDYRVFAVRKGTYLFAYFLRQFFGVTNLPTMRPWWWFLFGSTTAAYCGGEYLLFVLLLLLVLFFGRSPHGLCFLPDRGPRTRPSRTMSTPLRDHTWPATVHAHQLRFGPEENDRDIPLVWNNYTAAGPSARRDPYCHLLAVDSGASTNIVNCLDFAVGPPVSISPVKVLGATGSLTVTQSVECQLHATKGGYFHFAALYDPSVAACLMSTSDLCARDFKVQFQRDACLVSAGRTSYLTGSLRGNGLYYIDQPGDPYGAPPLQACANFSATSYVSIEDEAGNESPLPPTTSYTKLRPAARHESLRCAHEAMGHIGFERVRATLCGTGADDPPAADGIRLPRGTTTKTARDHNCPFCDLANVPRRPRNRQPANQDITGPNQMLCADLKTFPSGSIHHEYYASVVMDYYTKFVYVKLLRLKSEAVAHLEAVITHKSHRYGAPPDATSVTYAHTTDDLTQLPPNVDILRTDNGGEYIGQNVRELLKKWHVEQQRTVPHSPWMSAVEQEHKDLIRMVRSALLWARLPQTFWGLALLHAAHTKNTVLRGEQLRLRKDHPRYNKTPWELEYTIKPDLRHHLPFGAVAIARPNGYSNTLADKGVFVQVVSCGPHGRDYLVAARQGGHFQLWKTATVLFTTALIPQQVDWRLAENLPIPVDDPKFSEKTVPVPRHVPPRELAADYEPVCEGETQHPTCVFSGKIPPHHEGITPSTHTNDAGWFTPVEDEVASPTQTAEAPSEDVPTPGPPVNMVDVRQALDGWQRSLGEDYTITRRREQAAKDALRDFLPTQAACLHVERTAECVRAFHASVPGRCREPHFRAERMERMIQEHVADQAYGMSIKSLDPTAVTAKQIMADPEGRAAFEKELQYFHD